MIDTFVRFQKNELYFESELFARHSSMSNKYMAVVMDPGMA